MSEGHIRIDGKPYRVTDPKNIVRSNANQAAVKIAQGAGEYDDLQEWSIWLQNNWQAGVGHKDPTDGPLASTVDTRFKNQLSLPGFLRHITSTVDTVFPATYAASDAYHDSVDSVSAEPVREDVTIGDSQDIEELGWMFVANNVIPTPIEVLLPGLDEGCDTVTIKVWSVSDGAPDTVTESHDVALNGRVGWFWHSVAFTTLTSDSNKEFFVSIKPKIGTLTLPCVITDDDDHWEYDGEDWAGESTHGWMVRYHIQLAGSGAIKHVARFNNITYFARGTRLFKYNNNTIAVVDTLPQTITDLLSTGDRLYIGQNVAGNYQHMAANETITAASVPGEKFLLWRGFLWRSAVGRLFYTSDESTWIEVLPEVADRGYEIRGLGGHGDDVIVSTDNALYRVGWGDLVQTITNWGAPSATNGIHMLNFQGNLFISHGSSLLRYDGQSLLPMGPDLGEGLPDHFAGDIAGLASNNNWLLCAVAGPTSSVWIYNEQGWHFGCELPNGNTISATRYTSGDNLGFSTFVIGSDDATLHSIKIADTPRAMRRVTEGEDLTSQYHAWTGFLETDWFYGNLRELQKDVESLYVDGEQLGNEPHIRLYWRDELSSDWEELGQAENDNNELRFTNEGRRPACKRIRVGILLYSNFHLHTPVVSTIRLKYRPMLIDRWRWQTAIEVKDGQEMIDGTTNPRSAAQMLHELDQLTKRVTPTRFRDLDDEEYEVMVLNGSRQPGLVRWNPHANNGAGGKEVHWIYNLTLEQVSASSGFIGILDPTEISSVWGWWDFSDMSTMYTTSGGSTKVSTDGDPIGRIEDKSGNNRNMVQATSTRRPVYKIDIQNGLSSSLFAYTGGSSNPTEVNRLATAQEIDVDDMTLAVVYRISSSESNELNTIIAAGDVFTDNEGYYFLANHIFSNVLGTSWHTSLVTFSGLPSVVDTPSVALFTVRQATNNMYCKKNGASENKAATLGAAVGSHPVNIGTNAYDNTGNPFAGYIMEVIAFSPGLTAAQTNLVHAYLNNKWRIFQYGES